MRSAVYCGTRNLYGLMIPAVKSLIRNSDVERIYLLIEDDEFPHWMPAIVETRNVSGQEYFRKDGPNYKNGFTYMVLMRMALTKEFPELDEILSLDVDTIVRKDVSALWRLDLRDYYVAGVQERHPPYKGWPYVNCGVMVQNLRKLREDGKDDEIIEALNTRFYRWNEQDCMNELCRGHILRLDGSYNAAKCTSMACSPKITHYAAYQDWTFDPVWREYDSMPWDEIMEERSKR